MTHLANNSLTQANPDSDRSRWIALIVLCAGMLMIVLDATIVNVALPAIQSDLGFSQSSLAWVANAYLISATCSAAAASSSPDLPSSPSPHWPAASPTARRC
jgi:MFS family permease